MASHATPHRPARPASPAARPASHPAPSAAPAPPADAETAPVTYSVQLRLSDSLPEGGFEAWRAEIEEAAARENLDEVEVRRRLARRIEQELQAGHGSNALADPGLADAIAACLAASNGPRFQLRAWVVVPNRVQAVVTVAPGADVMVLARQWRMAMSREAAQRLDVDPRTFWERGAFVRACRDESDAQYRIRDVEFLPVNCGLCKRPRDWQWSSAHIAPGSPPAPGPGPGRRGP